MRLGVRAASVAAFARFAASWSREPFQQGEYDGLAFRGEGLEVAAVIVGHEGVAHGLKGRGIRQGIHQRHRLDRFGEARQSEQAVHREVEDVIGLGMGEAPRDKGRQHGTPVVAKPLDGDANCATDLLRNEIIA
jgi:hypothetical protein